MAGNPADLTVYIDSNRANDHTYYGNGGYGGATTPGSSRIATTKDNEDQINGVYYNFKAATSGTGDSISTDNTNSPDTFCPLGWQMPYGGSGGDYYNKSRSWKYLLTSYGFNFEESSTGITSYPISLVLSGYFLWRTAKLFSLNESATYHSETNTNNNGSYRIIVNKNGWSSMSTGGGHEKTEGHAIRCSSKFSILTIF